MDEDNRKGSLTSFFIKLIIVIIFAIFALWLLTSVSKGLNSNMDNINNSLNALTDKIFYENILRMKEAGKEYFTIERLPQNVGDVKSLTLKEMYEKKLLLELKDKNGKACSAENSYVMVEKFDKEYQMKVYLECGEEKDYITVIMGCYDYCSTTICEKNNNSNNNNVQLEYEYKKVTGGHWTDFGEWSEWSRIEITRTNYREVETKTVNETYTYDKTVYNKEYVSYEISCPSGYNITSDGTKCYKTIKGNEQVKPLACPQTHDGYTLVSQNEFICNYKKNSTTTTTTDPLSCAKTYNGYTLSSQNGFTCNYSKTISVPYNYTERVAKTCYSQQLVQSCSTCAPVLKNIPYDCSYDVTRTGYRNEITTTTTTVECPSGYTKNGNSCVASSTKTETKQTTTSCPSGYTKNSDNKTCSKETQEIKYTNINKTCPSGYNFTNDKTNCYREVASVIKATGTRQVTYYRYRIRQYIGGTVDYKWSSSKNDTSLINAGYTLTGNTRTKGEK